jgi:hypothetical protein
LKWATVKPLCYREMLWDISLAPPGYGLLIAAYQSLLDHGGNANEALQPSRLHAATVDPDYADWGSFFLVIRDELRPGGEAARRRSTPAGLREQYQIEQQRVTRLLDDPSEA